MRVKKEEDTITRTTALEEMICPYVMFVTYLEDLVDVDAILCMLRTLLNNVEKYQNF